MNLLAPLVAAVSARPSLTKIVDLMLNGVPATTALAYRQSLRAFAVSAGVHPDRFRDAAAEWIALPDVIRNRAAQNFVDSMEGAGIKPSTIKARLAALRRLLSTAVFHGAAEGALTIDQSPTVEHSFRGRDAEPADISSIRAAIGRHQHHSRQLRDNALLSLLYPTGLRISGELGGRCTGILGINRSDVSAGEIRVGLKGRETPHVIRPDERTISHIEKWIAFRQDDAPALFVGIDRNGQLTRERPLQQTVRNLLRGVGDSVGAGRCNPHAFRHAVGTQMLRTVGASLADVRDQLGHASLRTAERYVSYQDKSSAMGSRLNELV